MRIVLSVILVLHGLIHAMGFAKAFDYAKLEQLKLPISRPMGLLWLVAGLLTVGAALAPWRSFYWICVPAIVLSQIAICSSWSDAKFGTLANVIAVLAVVYSIAAYGPRSLRSEYSADVARAVVGTASGEILTEAALQRLPPPVQRYLRFSGAVGQKRPSNFRAHWKGRIRGAATDPWMDFVAAQVNTYGATQDRLFFMDAVMKGLPVDVYHRFVGDSATARVKVLSLVSMVNMKGPQMNHAETVTLFNDIALIAPAWLADPAIRYEAIDERSARAFFTRGSESISAVLEVAPSGMLVNFVSDDRSMAGKDGTTFTRVRWTTPLKEERKYGPYRLGSRGEARWHPTSEPDFAYIELELIDVEYDLTAP